MMMRVASKPLPAALLLSLGINMLKIIYKDYISPRSLIGKVVVITGAGSGIGKEMSIKFAKVSVSISVVARREAIATRCVSHKNCAVHYRLAVLSCCLTCLSPLLRP